MEINGEFLRQEVQNRLTAYYFILGSIDPDLNQQMKNKLPQIAHEIFTPHPDPGQVSPEKLRQIADQYQIDDIYLINRSGVIFATTFAPDRNFNLSQASANMGPFIEKMFITNVPVIEDIGISTNTGTLKKFGYYKSPDSDTIVEISVDINSALSKAEYPSLKDYINFGNNSQSISGRPMVEKFDLYTINQISQFSLLNEGKQLLPEIYENLKTQNPYRVQMGNTIITYTRFKPSVNNLWNPVFNPDYLVSEVWYNFEIQNSLFFTIIKNTLLILFFIIVLTFIISTWFFDHQIIRRVQTITTGLEAIELGDYDNTISIPGNDELNTIAHHINRMQLVIKSKMDDLLNNQMQLKAEIAERKKAKTDLDLAFHELETQEMEIRTSYQNYMESEKKFRLLHDNLRDGSIVLDPDTNILEFNSSFEALVGYSRSELTSMKVQDLIPVKWQESNAKLFDLIRVQGYSPLYEEEIRHRNGRIVPIEVQVYAICDSQGDITGFWALIRDISDRNACSFRRINSSYRSLMISELLLPLLWDYFT
ncbi:MAG TPA: PAS domain S-box protein [Methanospirillum sp.]|nr:PAS domain S-box protein [Methanospirillum sp.]